MSQCIYCRGTEGISGIKYNKATMLDRLKALYELDHRPEIPEYIKPGKLCDACHFRTGRRSCKVCTKITYSYSNMADTITALIQCSDPTYIYSLHDTICDRCATKCNKQNPDLPKLMRVKVKRCRSNKQVWCAACKKIKGHNLSAKETVIAFMQNVDAEYNYKTGDGICKMCMLNTRAITSCECCLKQSRYVFPLLADMRCKGVEYKVGACICKGCRAKNDSKIVNCDGCGKLIACSTIRDDAIIRGKLIPKGSKCCGTCARYRFSSTKRSWSSLDGVDGVDEGSLGGSTEDTVKEVKVDDTLEDHAILSLVSLAELEELFD